MLPSGVQSTVYRCIVCFSFLLKIESIFYESKLLPLHDCLHYHVSLLNICGTDVHARSLLNWSMQVIDDKDIRFPKHIPTVCYQDMWILRNQTTKRYDVKNQSGATDFCSIFIRSSLRHLQSLIKIDLAFKINNNMKGYRPGCWGTYRNVPSTTWRFIGENNISKQTQNIHKICDDDWCAVSNIRLV